MPNPTPTVFVPYHAIDDLHARGTRALQPTAPDVTPGTLYCVTDEQKVERSNGTIWESYSSSTTLPTNIAYKDQANVFTANQTISKAVPRLDLIDTSQPVDQRTFQIVNNAQVLTIHALNDAQTVASGTPLSLYRDGRVVITATAGNPTFKVSGPGAAFSMYDTSGAADAKLCKWQISSGNMTFYMLNDTDSVIQAIPMTIHRDGRTTHGGNVIVSASTPRYDLYDSAGTADARRWSILVTGGVFYLQPLADASGWQGNAVTLDRTGNLSIAGRMGAPAGLTVSAGNIDVTGGGAVGNESYFRGVSHIRVHLRVTSEPAGAQTFTIMNHQQQLIFTATPDDAGLQWTSGPSMRMGRSGNLTIEGDLDVGIDTKKGNLYTTYPVYPGRYDTGWTKQALWWIGGHGGYGLYINTGLYLEAGVTCAGNISASTITSSANINVGGNLHNTGGYIYPGRADSAGSIQASWYLGSHGSYGLYTNTGLYVEGGIYPGSIECRAHIRWVHGCYLTAVASKAIIVIPGAGPSFLPGGDNTTLFGDSLNRWYIVYTANGIATSSDLSTKKDLQPSTLGLAFLERLPVQRFQYIDDVEAKERIGFTVQDVESALAEDPWAQTVVIRKGGPAGLNYLGFVPVLTTAVQELSARLRALEAKVNG